MIAELSNFEITCVILSLFVMGGIAFSFLQHFGVHGVHAVIGKNLLATAQTQFILGLAVRISWYVDTSYIHFLLNRTIKTQT